MLTDDPVSAESDLIALGAERIEVRDGGGAAPRTVWAIVERMTPDAIPGATRATSPVIRITVCNDTPRGIRPGSVTLGAAKVLLSVDVGSDPVVRTLGAIEKQSGGLVTYRIN